MKRRPEIRLRSQARDLFILSTFGAGGGLFKRWGSFGLAKVMVSVFHKKKKRKLKLEKLKYMKLKLI